MPRISHTVQDAPGKWPTAGGLVTFLAADPANDEQFTLTGRELLLADNVGAGAHTITINSVIDPYNRTRNITAESIAAGTLRMFGPFDLVGWQQTDGNLYFEADDAEVEFAVIRLPAIS